MNSIKISTFYKFIELDSEKLETYRKAILRLCNQYHIKGTILIGTEGINATISGFPNSIDEVLQQLQQFEWLGEFNTKHSYAGFLPFEKMKVKVRPEIVVLKSGPVNTKHNTGAHVPPEQWNEFIQRDDVILIDARNDFEYKLGTFSNAINPATTVFSQFDDYVAENLMKYRDSKKIAMFCTGGIRCEKASAYMKEQGFPEVYQLEGGILNYFDKVQEQDSMWVGKCFVFDDRICVNHKLEPNGSLEDILN